MASYGAYILDNNDGTFSLSVLMRAPTTHTITGGTDLTTAAFEVAAQTVNSSGSVINGVPYQPQDVVMRQIAQIIAEDRSKNG